MFLPGPAQEGGVLAGQRQLEEMDRPEGVDAPHGSGYPGGALRGLYPIPRENLGHS